uniref:NADH-ubiquinone oxidoreductase chain 4 n=1 Tax=Pariaconus pele TaxID=1950172 RepID=A0A344A2M9_9HEMI|nr:NADH dehydrogenase subunit 4 [Pariaconus pele]AWU49020.1 NADH dehydrogenase subunit 4 [Pariaconus pele]
MLEVLFSLGLIAVCNHWLLNLNMLIIYFLWSLLNLYEVGEFNLKIIMILLSFWLVSMMIMSVDLKDKTSDLLIMFKLLLICLIMVFYSDSMIMFYMWFEISVLPVLLIIYGWGYQPDRLEAGFYMIMYTVLFSLPLLIMIFYLDKFIYLNKGVVILLMFIMAFLVKLPMTGFHFWLPRAHVEAPVYGSMILAGVMLKLGGYGLIKVTFFLGDTLFLYSTSFIFYSLLGALWLSCVCFTQSDMKMLVAYSSVVHMGIMLSGVLTLKNISIEGAVFMMMGHGLCSSGLFCILGVTYTRTLSRSIFLNKGIYTVMPASTLWWFMFCSSNLSFPPSLNLPAEILLITSIFSYTSISWSILILLGFISSMYSIYLFSYTQQGQTSKFFSFCNLSHKENLMMLLHWVPLNLLILDLSLMTFY